jgi:general stress protein 26
MKDQTANDDVRKLARLIKDIPTAMLTTIELDGSLRSRPMAVQQTDFDGDLWFFTKDRGPIVQETHLDAHVNVSFANTSDQRYTSVTGTARTLHDPRKAAELWNPMLKAWFPKGLEDPDLALLKVSVEKAEIWNAPGLAMVLLTGFSKRIAPDQRYQAGEHEKMNLSH